MKNKKKEEFDYAAFEREAISKLRSGKGLTGEGGALTDLIGRILTVAFEGEMEEHLSSDEEPGNRRNGSRLPITTHTTNWPARSRTPGIDSISGRWLLVS